MCLTLKINIMLLLGYIRKTMEKANSKKKVLKISISIAFQNSHLNFLSQVLLDFFILAAMTEQS